MLYLPIRVIYIADQIETRVSGVGVCQRETWPLEREEVVQSLYPCPTSLALHGRSLAHGPQRWTPSTGQLINVAKWNLLRYIPVKMRGAEDDKEETAQSCASV